MPLLLIFALIVVVGIGGVAPRSAWALLLCPDPSGRYGDSAGAAAFAETVRQEVDAAKVDDATLFELGGAVGGVLVALRHEIASLQKDVVRIHAHITRSEEHWNRIDADTAALSREMAACRDELDALELRLDRERAELRREMTAQHNGLAERFDRIDAERAELRREMTAQHNGLAERVDRIDAERAVLRKDIRMLHRDVRKMINVFNDISAGRRAPAQPHARRVGKHTKQS